jgi:PIN domain nuclease of toxin-antitoxin system
MILLDTNAVIWLATGHRRSHALNRHRGRLRVSPATLLEIAFLAEIGSVAVKGGLDRFREDDRWDIDEISAIDWFEEAETVTWTREPFDRLIVAHAARRRWKLATGDRKICENLPAARVLAL